MVEANKKRSADDRAPIRKNVPQRLLGLAAAMLAIGAEFFPVLAMQALGIGLIAAGF